MIEFSRFELANGLKVLIHEDDSTPMVAMDILYNVGARDESPTKTGFAHLFEHLMFSGSANIEDFDDIIQNAGGESNAFTNSDVTNFYNIIPAENIETMFWLESDRMLGLNFDEKALDIQRKVVVEEFKETCLNQPYGDVWHHITDLAYKVHPYRWPTIGKIPRHVEEATLEDVKDFFYKYYRPNNAILVVAGKTTVAEVKELAEKWFGDIPTGKIPKRQIPVEPPQEKFHLKTNQAEVPVDALFLAFHAPGRTEEDYYASDILSDILCNGPSSRLYRKLYKEQKLFTSIDAYVTGNIDPGLLIIEGKPATGVSIETAEIAIWKELENIKQEGISQLELQKHKNKIESTLCFSEANVLNKAINLAFFELLGTPELINDEVKYYQKLTINDINKVAQKLLTKSNCSELHYKSKLSS